MKMGKSFERPRPLCDGSGEEEGVKAPMTRENRRAIELPIGSGSVSYCAGFLR